MATTTQAIEEIYIGLLGRAADAGGLAYWTAEIDGGTLTLEQLRANIVNEQPEYAADLGSKTRAQVVSELYNRMFERAADAEGLEYWVSGGGSTVNVDQLVLALSNSASTADRLVLDNKVEAATYYSANTLDADYTADKAKASVDSVDATSASVQSSKDATDADAHDTGVTLALTTGVDTFIGTSSDDTFNATAGTWTPLDSINGGAGTDVVNIAQTAAITAIPTGATLTNIETLNLISGGAITTVNTSTLAVGTLNITATGASGVTAAATSDVNEAASIAASSITGGKDVTISHGTAGTVTANATAGALSVTSSFGAVLIGGNQDASAATDALGSVTVDMTATAAGSGGAVDIDGGTTLSLTASGALSATDRAAHIAADTAAETAEAAAETAEAAAEGVDAGLTTMAAGLAADTTIAGNNAETLTALKAGYITQAQKVAIDAAFAAGIVTNAATAQAATLAVYTSIQTTAATALTAAGDALTAAGTAETAAEAVLTADAAIDAATATFDLTATENTALTTATVVDTRGATVALTDASTASNTLTTANLTNTGVATLTGKALSTVNLTQQTAKVTVVNATAANTVTVNADTVTGEVDVETSNATTTVNVAGTGTSSFTLSADDATALNISGAGNTTLAATLAAAAVITSTATGNVTMNVAAGQTYTGGTGIDTITTDAGPQTKAVDGGAGTADVVVITNAANSAATPSALFSNFETLGVSGTTTVNAALFTNSTFTGIALSGGGAQTISAISAAMAANVAITSSTGFVFTVTGATTPGNIDTLTISHSDAVAALTVSAAGVEKFIVDTSTALTVATLVNVDALTNMTFTGAGNVSITTAALAANTNTAIDASALTGTFTWDGDLSTGNGMAITGSATAVNTITVSDDGGLTNVVTGGAANDALTGDAGNDSLNGGEGNNTITTVSGTNTLTAGDGHNTITGGSGVDTITVGNGYNTIVAAAGADVITVGTGGNNINGGTGADTITAGTTATGVVNIYTQAITDSIVASAETTTGAIAAGQTVTFATGSAGSVDVITGFDAVGGDTIDAVTAGAAITMIGTNEAALADDTTFFASGAYVAATGVFTIAADGTGADTMIMQVESTGTAASAVVSTNTNALILVGVDSDDLSAATFF